MDVFREFQLEMDMGEYKSVSDFNKKYHDLPSKATFYAEGTLKAAGVGVPYRIETDPFSCGTSKIPIFPKYKEGSSYFYCSDQNPPYTYKMHTELEDIGLLGWFWNWTPKMRIYFEDDDKQSEPVETFDLKCKEGSDMRIMDATKRSNLIMTNMPYIAQTAMVETLSGGRYFTVPLVDLPFILEIPEMEIDENNLRVSQSLTARNATPAELSNPTVVANKGGKLGWIRNNQLYLYRYKIDIPVVIEAPRLIRRWGIHLNDNYASSSEFIHKEGSKDAYINRVVRMTWYSNEPSFYLSCFPFADLQDAKGNKGGKKNFSSVGFTVNYSQFLDQQYSMTGGGKVDYEKSRRLTTPAWNIQKTDLPWGNTAVCGDIELIEGDDGE